MRVGDIGGELGADEKGAKGAVTIVLIVPTAPFAKAIRPLSVQFKPAQRPVGWQTPKIRRKPEP
jgi:hypothetical protein